MNPDKDVFENIVKALTTQGFLFLDTGDLDQNHKHFNSILKAVEDRYPEILTPPGYHNENKTPPVYAFVEDQDFRNIGHCEKAVLFYIGHRLSSTSGSGEVYYAAITPTNMVFLMSPYADYGEFPKQEDHKSDIVIYTAKILSSHKARDIETSIVIGLNVVSKYMTDISELVETHINRWFSEKKSDL